MAPVRALKRLLTPNKFYIFLYSQTLDIFELLCYNKCVKLDVLKKRAIFKALANGSQYRVGVDFGFDKEYKSNTSVINAINKIYVEVRENPEKYSIEQETLEMVERGMALRKTMRHAITDTPFRSLEELDTRELVLGLHKKSLLLLNRKLDFLMKSKKHFNEESAMSLAKIAGILFDKAQITKGEATENIAIRSKIDPNISVSDAISQLLKIREAQAVE